MMRFTGMMWIQPTYVLTAIPANAMSAATNV